MIKIFVYKDYKKIIKIIGLSAGLVSLLFITEAFFYLMQGYDFHWIEPNKFIATLEFTISGVAMFILIYFIYSYIKEK